MGHVTRSKGTASRTGGGGAPPLEQMGQMCPHCLFLLQRCRLRLSHLFPRQPDGQSHTSGPTHLPPFMHEGWHTPADRPEVRSRWCDR